MHFRVSSSLARALLIALLVVPALAEEAPDGEPPAEAASPGESPASPTPAPAKTIWDFQKEIGLTEDQVTAMKETLGDFQKSIQQNQKKLVDGETQLKALIDEEAPLDKIREKLEEIGKVQIQMRFKDVSTSRKVNGTMKPAQLAKWREIQRMARPSGEK